MKTSLVIAFVAVCLVQSSLSLSCGKGFYDGGSTRCTQCTTIFTECTAAAKGTLNSRIAGANLDSTGSVVNWCAAGAYNKDKSQCESKCKDGCYGCLTDYDFCTDCHAGYAWNPDYTCLPSIIGLEAASLALLVLALVFLVIGCCYVNKARK